MTRIATQISMSSRVKTLMEQELNKRQIAMHYAKRMQIILQGSSGRTSQDIASEISCTLDMVRLWRRRWKANESELLKYEQGYNDKGVSDKTMVRKIKEILSDEQRPGAPARITSAEKNRLQALACEAPEKYDLPVTNWTHETLSKQAKKMEIKVSPAHMGRILKKTNYARINQPIGFFLRLKMKKSSFQE